MAQRRKTLGLTQEQLAELLDVDRNTVARWERGDAQPLPWLRPKLARALGVSADRLEELLAGPGSAGSPDVAAGVPRQLPAAVPHFTGRLAELAALARLVDEAAAGTLVISAIGGTAGVGKTALAVRWAHTVAARFPGGQLYVNLRGYDPDRPVPAADALAGFLRALGVGGQDIPAEEEERAAQYRSMLAGKRVLIVLDNAGSVEQVRPLLPGSAGCVVVVTSRDSLAGLVARHGAARVELDVLPLGDAVGLLGELIGSRVADDRAAAQVLAERCGRLPLALRVAAELAATRPGVTLAELAGELSDQRGRLDLLAASGDHRTAVRAVFSWSCRHLDASTGRAFRLLGLHPGGDFDIYAASALVGSGLGEARGMLDALARAHLIQPAGRGRYGMHDLLRAYARELAESADGEQEQDAALTRLFDHYLHTASVMVGAVYPAESHRRPRVSPSAAPAPPVTGPAAARAWLDTELANLASVTVHAAAHGWASHATRLSETLFRYLDHGGHYPEAVTIHTHARSAAQRTGDLAAEASALNYLGNLHRRQNRYQQAADHLNAALGLFRQVGDLTAQARALGNLGNLHHHLGRYREAISLHQQALVTFAETGDVFGQAIARVNLGIAECRLGRYDLAARHFRRAMAIAADIGARELECIAISSLGSVALLQGRYQEAVGDLDRGIALCREIGYRDAQAEALTRLGDLRLRQGKPGEAARHMHEALSLCRELGSQSGEADVLNSLGAVQLVTGQHDHARTGYATALDLASQGGDKYQQARAHFGLGQACRAGGDTDAACRHWRDALALFTELGTPEAAEVRAQLTAAEGAGPNGVSPGGVRPSGA